MNNRKNILLIVSLSIFLFLLIINTAYKTEKEFLDPAGDSKSYLSLAKSINEEKTFVRQEFLNQNSVETVRTPGYPIFLSLFSNNKNVVYVQNFLHIISAFLVYKIIEKRTSNIFAVIFMLLYLFNPLLISLSQLILTETLSIFLINVLLFLLLERDKVVLLSIIISILPLIRPAFLIVVLGFVIFNKIIFKNLEIKKRFLILFLIISPSLFWIQRNYELTDQIIFSSITGMNLLEDTASGIMAINEDIRNNESFLEVVDIRYDEKRYWSQVLRNEVDLGDISRVVSNAPGRNPHEVANAYQSYAIKIIFKYPMETSVLVMRAFLYNTLEPGDQIYNSILNLNKLNFLYYFMIVINAFLTLITIFSILKTIKNKEKFAIEIILYMLMLSPLLLLATPNGRFGSILFSTAIIICAKYLGNLDLRFVKTSKITY